jgi:hypothetical protein
MSISSIMLENQIAEFKEVLKFNLRQHSHEIIVGAIMTAVSITLAVAATGDWSQAFAHRNRR